MRPRPDAAENDARPAMAAVTRRRFNEAAARCRGKRRGGCRAPRSCRCFNEAAARCRGKHHGLLVGVRADVASMRPRPDAAENAGADAVEAEAGAASMRPRPDAAENQWMLSETNARLERLQ